ncbi:MAG TPA: TetR/AcrR family transcriptional regulator [Actinospica sp.]|jgi:AcrR family transcriptional regulator|nr:TetR/AcrR family transcriptional regulator [Actinospica sp.]
MARRGDQLREHILWTAKDVFLEMGYERTSMDVVAARAETSKRSLYAHFESKERLFGDVVGLVRELNLGHLRTPAAYGADPAEAVVRFCGRFLQMQLWDSALRTLRIGIAEAERLPEAAAAYHEAIFETPQRRLADYLVEQYGLDEESGHEIARRLIGRAVYPQLIRSLLGVDAPLAGRPDETTLADDVDLESLRAAVAALLPPAVGHAK